mmetsp:Transcript_27901/g.75883  ORF Transcript_27901/g.75883 Transcript_27901/m.75883 type:complete len:97 (-) Transcript_27901:73-363(-)
MRFPSGIFRCPVIDPERKTEQKQKRNKNKQEIVQPFRRKPLEADARPKTIIVVEGLGIVLLDAPIVPAEDIPGILILSSYLSVSMTILRIEAKCVE